MAFEKEKSNLYKYAFWGAIAVILVLVAILVVIMIKLSYCKSTNPTNAKYSMLNNSQNDDISNLSNMKGLDPTYKIDTGPRLII